jgi:hypothetical protein
MARIRTQDRVVWRPQSALPYEAFTLPRKWAHTFDTSDTLPYRVGLELEGDRDGPRCRAVRVDADPDGPPVTASGLRAIPLGRLTEIATASVIGHVAGAITEMSDSELAEFVKRSVERTSDPHLREVAHIYLSAPSKPTRAVHEHWPFVSYSTAARWVMLARRRGFLPPAERRKKR